MKYCIGCEHFNDFKSKCQYFNIYITSISNAEICSKYKENENKKRFGIKGDKMVICRRCNNYILNSYCKVKKESIRDENKMIKCNDYLSE